MYSYRYLRNTYFLSHWKRRDDSEMGKHQVTYGTVLRQPILTLADIASALLV